MNDKEIELKCMSLANRAKDLLQTVVEKGGGDVRRGIAEAHQYLVDAGLAADQNEHLELITKSVKALEKQCGTKIDRDSAEVLHTLGMLFGTVPADSHAMHILKTALAISVSQTRQEHLRAQKAEEKLAELQKDAE